MKEECGISGIIFFDNIYKNKDIGIKLYNSLHALQHRGQDSMGIYINNNSKDGILYKKMGLVSEFDVKKLENIIGISGIAHVRGAMKNTVNLENCQPFYYKYEHGYICISYNGNLINSDDLRKELILKKKLFYNESDCEIIAYLLIDELQHNDIITSIKNIMNKIVGAYSLVLLINDSIYAIRDPYAIKPLCFGYLENENGYIIASESVAIDCLNGKLIRDLKPGEIIEFNNNKTINYYETCNISTCAHCIFEYIYLSRPDSILDGLSVYNVREKLGKILAIENKYEKYDLISPIPDSGIIASIGYSKESKIDYKECLVKNRYVGRTFILPTQKDREDALKLKLNPIKCNIKKKNILFVDDSIVRGTTTKMIINEIKNLDAESVHLKIASPPIISPCYFGVDIKNKDDLIASKLSIKELCYYLNVDSLSYISINGLLDAIGIPKNKLCLGCITKEYPFEINYKQ